MAFGQICAPVKRRTATRHWGKIGRGNRLIAHGGEGSWAEPSGAAPDVQAVLAGTDCPALFGPLPAVLSPREAVKEDPFHARVCHIPQAGRGMLVLNFRSAPTKFNAFRGPGRLTDTHGLWFNINRFGV